MISIIIPVLNEKQWILDKTIKSIRDTSDAEIVVVNDNSDNIINIYDKNIIYHKNDIRHGAAQSKHIGVCLSSKKYIFLTDSHVLFQKNWYEKALESLQNNNQTLFCGTCLGLSENNFSLDKYNGKYCGAELFLYDNKNKQILDGKWTKIRKPDEYEISCVMGANYFMHKDWFFKIRGYGDLRAWGSEEPCLSIKTWLSGGTVKVNRDVIIGHMFRDVAPYTTYVKDILYNKIRMAYSFCSTSMYEKLLNKIAFQSNFYEAMKLFMSHINIINGYKQYYQQIFTRDLNWLCQKFQIQIE